MPDFKLAKIYKIIPLNQDHESDIYIGSTCKPRLSQRLTKHRGNYKQWKKGNGSHIRSYDIFDKYGVENCNIFLIEDFPCETKDQLMKKEGYYIKNIPCVNKVIAGRTIKEGQKVYYENNKEAICNWQKQYYEDNKESKKENQKQYYENNKKYLQTKFNCICGGCYTRDHKRHHVKSLKHINYITKHDDIIEKVNDLIISINNEQFNIITI